MNYILVLVSLVIVVGSIFLPAWWYGYQLRREGQRVIKARQAAYETFAKKWNDED